MITLSRRGFLGVALVGCSSAIFPASGKSLPVNPINDANSVLPSSGSLTRDEWQSLRVIVDAIIPASSRGVSASEAGVLHYIDKSLNGFHSALLPSYRRLLNQLENDSLKSGLQFKKLGQSEIIATLERLEREQPDKFNMVRRHAIEGFFSAPRHGGNANCRGWKLVRLQSRVLPWDEVQGP